MPKTKLKSKSVQKERTELTCQRFLEAAEEIFVRDGFQASRLEDISKLAGYTRGAFYANFDSKEDLFIILAECRLKLLLEEIRVATLSASGVDKKIKMLLQVIDTDEYGYRWALLMIEFSLFVLRQPKLKSKVLSMRERLLGGMESVFLDLFSTANLKPVISLAVISSGFAALVQGLTLERALDEKRMPASDISKLLICYLNAILASGKAYSQAVPRQMGE